MVRWLTAWRRRRPSWSPRRLTQEPGEAFYPEGRTRRQGIYMHAYLLYIYIYICSVVFVYLCFICFKHLEGPFACSVVWSVLAALALRWMLPARKPVLSLTRCLCLHQHAANHASIKLLRWCWPPFSPPSLRLPAQRRCRLPSLPDLFWGTL